jgi:hypothetical protein
MSAIGVAAGIAILAGIRGLQARQESIAEREREHLTATAAAAAEGTARPSAPAIPVAPSGAVAESAPPVISPEPPSSGVGQGVEPPPTVGGLPAASSAGLDVPAALPSSRPYEAEKPLDVGPEAPGGSLVMRANRALRTGAKDRALEFARQAVHANPADADGWLMLGAAYQASGDKAAARDAYRNCVAQAHTVNVSDCRVLAGQ